MGRTRTFIGVAIGEGIRREARSLRQSLAQCGAGVKWVEPENFHITLLFLGELDDTELVAACRATAKATAGVAPFALKIEGVGAFPNVRRPKTIWAGVTEGATELSNLHAAIAGPLLESGIARREERGYTPHLTLGRADGETDSELLAAELPKYRTWLGGQTAVGELLVYRSELRRDGVEHTVIGRSELQ